MPHINNQYGSNDLPDTCKSRLVQRDGTEKMQDRDVLHEHVINFYVNEVLTMKVTATPAHLPELVIGRLFSEGVIADADEVEALSICEFGTEIRVFLKEQTEKAPIADPDFMEITPTCCTDNRILNSAALVHRELHPVPPHSWKREDVFLLADRFAEGMPLHRKTWGTHSCFLLHKGQIVFSCEDLGRHNALDKVIGHALLERIPLAECMLYTSGRTPVDMVSKAIRAGIPVLVSKAVPTAEAVQLAKQYGLTLICSARRDSFLVLNDAGQVL